MQNLDYEAVRDSLRPGNGQGYFEDHEIPRNKRKNTQIPYYQPNCCYKEKEAKVIVKINLQNMQNIKKSERPKQIVRKKIGKQIPQV